MSKQAIIVLIVVAIALGTTLFLMNRQSPQQPAPGSSTAPSGPAFEIEPSQVQAVSLTGADGTTRAVFRTELGGWIYAEADVQTQPTTGWPADATRVNSALRTIQLIPTAGEAGQTALGSNTALIRMRLSDGTIRSIRAEREAIGGNTLAQIDDDRVVLVRADTLQPIFSEGPGDWRIRNPLAGLTTDASRLTITSGDRRVSLAKVENRWIMRSPISARADDAVVRTVLEAILNMRVASFDPSATSIDSPVVTISAERDDAVQPDGSARRVTTRELTIGAQADPRTGNRFAVLRGSSLPSNTSLVLERADIQTDEQFAALARPEAFLSRRAAHERPSDIGIVLVRPLAGTGSDRAFRRDLEGWNEMRPDGGMRTAEIPDRTALEEVLTLLTQTQGDPRIASDIDDFRALTRIELYTLDDSDLGSIQAGYANSGTLALRRGNVMWLYPETAVPSMLMMPAHDQVDPLPQREPSSAGNGAEEDDNK